MEPITLDELLCAVEQAGKSREGFTTDELRARRPMSVAKARDLLKRAIKQKLIRPSRKTITDIAGRPSTVPSYVVIKRRGRKG